MAVDINFGAWPISTNTSLTLTEKKLVRVGGFICTTAGSIKVYDGIDNTGRVTLNTVALTAGQYLSYAANHKDGFYIEPTGGAVVTVLAAF